MHRTCAWLVAILLTCVGGQASAQAAHGDVAEGGELVAERCSTCHSLHHATKASQQAPSLTSVARMHSTTSLSLHAFLLTPHPNMPNYILTPKEVDDVVAYILSLRRH